jgi:hypothetical protein
MHPHKILDIAYYVKEERFIIRGNVLKKDRANLIESYRAYISILEGLGDLDKRLSNQQEVYRIKLKLDIRSGEFEEESDTGNRNMTEGILITLLEKIRKEQT